jgi:hypothetical protein
VVRVAALYDVHGNLPALDAVLTEVDADVILIGGNFVAGFPDEWPKAGPEEATEFFERASRERA